MNIERLFAMTLALALICLIASLYLTVHDHIHPVFKYGAAQLVFNWVLSMQAVGVICVIFGFLLVLLKLSGRVEPERFHKILRILLSIAAGALVFAAAIDLIYYTDFPYAFTYTGTMMAVVTAVSTKVNLFKIL